MLVFGIENLYPKIVDESRRECDSRRVVGEGKCIYCIIRLVGLVTRIEDLDLKICNTLLSKMKIVWYISFMIKKKHFHAATHIHVHST